MIRYKYYLIERPPGPGCQPTDGLCETQDYGYQRECMGEMVRAWGFALYRRRALRCTGGGCRRKR